METTNQISELRQQAWALQEQARKLEYDARRKLLRAFYEEVKPALQDFTKVWFKFNDSGVCDTEGRAAIQQWLIDSLREGKSAHLTFEQMEGYSGHKRSEKCPFSKSEIATSITRELRKLASTFDAARGLAPGVDVADLVNNCF